MSFNLSLEISGIGADMERMSLIVTERGLERQRPIVDRKTHSFISEMKNQCHQLKLGK
jgi:hypothetical protein